MKILASIQHQHVLAFLGLCHYYDLKSEMSSVVLVTEWCPSTLRHWIKDHARNSTQLQSVAPRLVEEVASGMDHLHRRCGIVHRDLKPGNVLLTGEVRRSTAFVSQCMVAFCVHDLTTRVATGHSEDLRFWSVCDENTGRLCR